MAKKKKAPKELSEKHQMFVDKYLVCWNATEAYRFVYPKATYASARTLGSNLLTNVDIRAEISARLKVQAMAADEVLARLTEQARGSLEPFVEINSDGFPRFDFSSQDAKDRLHLIKKLKTKRSRRVEGKGDNAETWEDEFMEVEIIDAQKALEMMGRYHNLWTEKDDDGNPLTDEQRIARVMAILDVARARRST